MLSYCLCLCSNNSCWSRAWEGRLLLFCFNTGGCVLVTWTQRAHPERIGHGVYKSSIKMVGFGEGWSSSVVKCRVWNDFLMFLVEGWRSIKNEITRLKGYICFMIVDTCSWITFWKSFQQSYIDTSGYWILHVSCSYSKFYHSDIITGNFLVYFQLFLCASLSPFYSPFSPNILFPIFFLPLIPFLLSFSFWYKLCK